MAEFFPYPKPRMNLEQIPNYSRLLRNNAKQWLWGPFPADFQFPWYHRLRYIYKLEGQRTHFPFRPLIVKTHLPDEIEIIAIPCDKTYLELEMVPPSNE